MQQKQHHLLISLERETKDWNAKKSLEHQFPIQKPLQLYVSYHFMTKNCMGQNVNSCLQLLNLLFLAESFMITVERKYL